MASTTDKPLVPDDDSKDIKDEHLPTQHLELTDRDVETGAIKKRGVNTQIDDAARLLEEAGGQITISPADRKRVLRKIDLWVCVPMCIVYCIQSLDKGSVSSAAVQLAGRDESARVRV